MSEALNIISVGLNAQDRLVLNTAAKLLSYDGIGYRIHDGQLANAHILILDNDNNEGKTALRQSRPGQIKLVISDKPGMAKNTIGLQRPVDLGALKTVLKRLYARLQEQLHSQQQQAAQAPRNIEELKDTLFNILLVTKQNKTVLRITADGLPDFFVDGHNQCLASTATESDIGQLAQLPFTAIRITQMNKDGFAVHSNNLSIQSLHNLLWLTGIKCSHGRLVAGHDLDTPFRLRAWPNFTRNTFIAEHLKLAALLARQAMSLRQLAEHTGVALAEVINFYNAALAVDLIEFSAAAGGDIAARPQNLARQGLFSRIAQRLNLKNLF